MSDPNFDQVDELSVFAAACSHDPRARVRVADRAADDDVDHRRGDNGRSGGRQRRRGGMACRRRTGRARQLLGADDPTETVVDELIDLDSRARLTTADRSGGAAPLDGHRGVARDVDAGGDDPRRSLRGRQLRLPRAEATPSTRRRADGGPPSPAAARCSRRFSIHAPTSSAVRHWAASSPQGARAGAP